jgi:multidrug efflux pump subunit AcrB
LSNPRVEGAATQPTIEIEVDLDKAQQVGISPGDVRRAEATLLQGIQVGSVFEDQKVFDVIVLGTPATRSSVSAVQSLLIDRPGGGHIRLATLPTSGSRRRRRSFAATLFRGAWTSSLILTVAASEQLRADLEQQLATMSFPLEYHAEVITNSTADEMNSGA